MEKILRVEEKIFKTDKKDWATYDGFEVVTDKQTIQIGISDGQSCCESFGCFVTNDDITEFIGAKLKKVSITDLALNNKALGASQNMDDGGCMFVNLETSKGLLQFVAYNHHNGYYGHEAVLVSAQLNHSESL